MQYYFPSTPKVINNVPRGFDLNQFTINPTGELSSSLQFVYTQSWAWAYQILRVSNNTIVVDEAQALDRSLVLFSLNGSSIVDESDSFYGESNNGRDCIRAASEYNYSLTSCFFQNDQSSYPVDKYLLGNVRTTGIARYTDRFSFALNTWNTTMGGSSFLSYQFSLTPLTNVDFSYSVDYQGNICPALVNSNQSISTCYYYFYFTGSGPVTFGSSLATSSPLTFDIWNMTSVSVSFAGARQTIINILYVGGAPCYSISCSPGGNTQSSVFIGNPQISIISASDVVLNDSIAFVTSQTSASVQALNSIQGVINATKGNLSKIQDQLGSLDFNTTKIVPYSDFSDLRAKTQALINSLSPAGSRDCANGVFGSVGCWFEDALSTLIVLGILVAIAVGIYCLCIKFNLCGNLCGKTAEF